MKRQTLLPMLITKLMNSLKYEIFNTLKARIVFRQIKKLCPEISFAPGFASISPINNIKNDLDQAVKSNYITKYKKDTKTLRTRKEWNL